MYYELARQPIRIYINLLQWHNWKKNDQNFITFNCCYNIWSINNNRYKIMLYTSLYRLGNNLMRCRPHNIHPTPHPLTPPSPPAQGSTLIFKVTCAVRSDKWDLRFTCPVWDVTCPLTLTHAEIWQLCNFVLLSSIFHLSLRTSGIVKQPVQGAIFNIFTCPGQLDSP